MSNDRKIGRLSRGSARNLTPFGKMVRKHRVDRNETGRDMASSMGVSAAYLSASETGIKRINDRLFNMVVDHLELDEKQREELFETVAPSQPSLTINLSGLCDEDRDLIVRFQRRFPRFKDHQKKAIMKILLSED